MPVRKSSDDRGAIKHLFLRECAGEQDRTRQHDAAHTHHGPHTTQPLIDMRSMTGHNTTRSTRICVHTPHAKKLIIHCTRHTPAHRRRTRTHTPQKTSINTRRQDARRRDTLYTTRNSPHATYKRFTRHTNNYTRPHCGVAARGGAQRSPCASLGSALPLIRRTPVGPHVSTSAFMDTRL